MEGKRVAMKKTTKQAGLIDGPEAKPVESGKSCSLILTRFSGASSNVLAVGRREYTCPRC